MIKILYILEATSGGTQKHVIDIAKKIDKSKFQIDIIFSINRNKHFIEESNGIFNMMYGLPIPRGASFSDLINIFRIRKIIKTNNYDIVHCHSTKAGFVGRLAAFLSQHPNVIYSPHGFMFCDTRIKFKRHLYLNLEKYLGYLTNKIIAVSGSERDLAIHYQIVPNKKIITLYNSIDPSDYDDFNYRNKVHEKLLNNQSEIILGTVGRLYYQKDPIMLIKSFKVINDRFPNTKLIIVGDGPLEKECIKLINKLNLETKINLAGFQKNSRAYYEMFDIFMLSSHYEGLPYSLLEAMMMGIPSVGTDVVGIKDLILDGETGYLVNEGNYLELADAVIKMLENPDLLSIFSTNAKNRAKVNFNFVEGIKDYQDFYIAQCTPAMV
ncbi:MAG: glycosyltransferase family 4 protein [Ignavibacteriaceae bacterium]|jgi:glycosyltransferase involved in cell wall biosynthesis|nr:glycosyltransferase family 4 protein [Ignavibacteriaceae bacterium]MCW8996985.1 glycosyltransferase family 4 protein [Psychromonas sp.]MCW8817137.1 glycosyltransferase family 4 protein [Ignavibacteriaceae bacterium]MCW8823151.1 glycosyltransferase family 4 protein [Ignavibacteriaceae bacterium]MCW9094628.1 glycosyltransferase family 4 protein [Ignavibacteriaceae bacterium]